jgi:16S rRNA G1207 methylase RsmC
LPHQQQQQQQRRNKVTATRRENNLNKRQLVLLVEDTNAAAAEAVGPLAQRNAINAALQAVANTVAVVASVYLTAKKYLILTTTEEFTADFLLQHTDT